MFDKEDRKVSFYYHIGMKTVHFLGFTWQYTSHQQSLWDYNDASCTVDQHDELGKERRWDYSGQDQEQVEEKAREDYDF